MLRLFSCLLVCLLICPILLSPTLGAEQSEQQEATQNDADAQSEETNPAEAKPEEGEEKSGKPKQETHRVEREPLKVNVDLEGTFIAQDREEVDLQPEVWKEFTVVEAVEHGAKVNKGDVLVRFDKEGIDKQIAEDTIQQRLDELALLELEEDVPRQRKLLEIAYEQARLAHEQLEEDIEYYKNTDRPWSVRMVNHRVESSEEDLASQEEELAQLEKMYAADDLTEETEEIVLRRQKFQVETAKLYLEFQKLNRDYTLNVRLPRTDESYARQLKQAKLALEQAKTAKDIGTTRGTYRLEEKRSARAYSIRQHAKLLGDRALMEIRAPSDGVAYYGSFEDGDLSEVSSLAGKLKPHGSVSPGTVLMTIVKQRPLGVQTNIGESDLPDLKVGLTAQITPTADDDLSIPAKVAKLSAIPNAKTEFPLELGLDQEDLPDWLVAGMTCEAEITVYEKEDALVIPCELVQTDEEDEELHYVMVVRDEKEPERCEVELGRSDGKKVEVLKGLSEGDQIVKEQKSKEDS